MQLETFKKALMQSLQEDDETATVSSGAMDLVLIKYKIISPK